MQGRHIPPDHSRGDESTLGGYMAVHSRPAAFEGADGLSYSVDIVVDETGDPAAPYAAYLLFLRWGTGEPSISGHLESGYLVTGMLETEVRERVGAMPLEMVKRTLDTLARGQQEEPPARTWWEAMRDESDG